MKCILGFISKPRRPPNIKNVIGRIQIYVNESNELVDQINMVTEFPMPFLFLDVLTTLS